jgi:hypothetical protein
MGVALSWARLAWMPGFSGSHDPPERHGAQLFTIIFDEDFEFCKKKKSLFIT